MYFAIVSNYVFEHVQEDKLQKFKEMFELLLNLKLNENVSWVSNTIQYHWGNNAQQ